MLHYILKAVTRCSNKSTKATQVCLCPFFMQTLPTQNASASHVACVQNPHCTQTEWLSLVAERKINVYLSFDIMNIHIQLCQIPLDWRTVVFKLTQSYNYTEYNYMSVHEGWVVSLSQVLTWKRTHKTETSSPLAAKAIKPEPNWVIRIFFQERGADETRGQLMNQKWQITVFPACFPCSHREIYVCCALRGQWMGKQLAACHLWLLLPASRVGPAGAEQFPNHFLSPSQLVREETRNHVDEKSLIKDKVLHLLRRRSNTDS